MITIYGLTDEMGQIRYVGQTLNCKARFYGHQKSAQFPVAGMAILSRQVKRKAACAAERRWIKFFGHENLWNSNRGQSSLRCEELTVPFTLRVEHSLIQSLKREAGPYGSVSKVIRHLIEKSLNGK